MKKIIQWYQLLSDQDLITETEVENPEEVKPEE